MPDDLRERIESLRRLRDAASPLPWAKRTLEGIVSEPLRVEHQEKVSRIPAGSPAEAYGGLPQYHLFMVTSRWTQQEKGRADEAYLIAATNLAPALADAYDAAQATIAERDAEIARLREANARLTDAATNCALRATLSALSGATDG